MRTAAARRSEAATAADASVRQWQRAHRGARLHHGVDDRRAEHDLQPAGHNGAASGGDDHANAQRQDGLLIRPGQDKRSMC